MKKYLIVILLMGLLADCVSPVTSVSLGPQRRGTPPVAIFESPIEPTVTPRSTLAPPISPLLTPTLQSPVATPTARPTPQ